MRYFRRDDVFDLVVDVGKYEIKQNNINKISCLVVSVVYQQITYHMNLFCSDIKKLFVS